MSTKTQNYVAQFHYDKSMLPFFNEGKDLFRLQTMIDLNGIEFSSDDDRVTVTIFQEQHEQYLFHLAFCIGQLFGKSLSS